ncbi:lanc-like protein 2 [Stylonychia lemnae]|uniref:Lanc-like protein 2 n=1 Tax=Stylonychia lemnae TaxID=5949 RepID=A0A078ACM8_STYLE|nr:lanc-like protein 2 [Stylonychia lemnae]|eukprot:CDW79616.1 lanc-like protein 2 [Stylonychia lemnae]
MEDFSLLNRIRYFDNNLDIDQIPEKSFDETIKDKLFTCKQNCFTFIIVIKNQESKNSDPLKIISSTVKIRQDISAYIGSAGYLYMYYRLYEYAKRSNQPELKDEYFAKAVDLYDKLKPFIEQYEIQSVKQKSMKIPTFFIGTPAYYLIGCLLFKDQAKEEQAQLGIMNCMKKILSFMVIFEEEGYRMEDELLYGNAGYLYCLLVLKLDFSEYFSEQVDDAITRVVADIVRAGLVEGNSFLTFSFPRGKKPYIGAAHGSIGILYMIIKAMQLLPDLQKMTNLKDVVIKSLDDLVSRQTKAGHFGYQMSQDPQGEAEAEYAVHFCHGAPGSIPLFVEACKTFGSKRYLEAATLSAECTWKYGLIKKGFGLCHGICGNAILMMCLYRFTNDEIWKKRAEAFIKTTLNNEILQGMDEYEFSGFTVQGVPDHPYSLMEGQAGTIVALADFSGWPSDTQYFEYDIKFPGFEI